MANAKVADVRAASIPNDPDPTETAEWLESLDYVLESKGPERVQQLLTALDEVEDRIRGFIVGTDDYLSKPFDRTELLARVHRILQRTYGYDDTTGSVPRL